MARNGKSTTRLAPLWLAWSPMYRGPTVLGPTPRAVSCPMAAHSLTRPAEPFSDCESCRRTWNRFARRADRFPAPRPARLDYGRADSTTVFNVTGAPAVSTFTKFRYQSGLEPPPAWAGNMPSTTLGRSNLIICFYDLGGATAIGLPVPSNDGVQTHSHFGLTGQLARFGLNYRPDWARPSPVSTTPLSMPNKTSPIKDFEMKFGLRYWYSTGKTKIKIL